MTCPVGLPFLSCFVQLHILQTFFCCCFFLNINLIYWFLSYFLSLTLKKFAIFCRVVLVCTRPFHLCCTYDMQCCISVNKFSVFPTISRFWFWLDQCNCSREKGASEIDVLLALHQPNYFTAANQFLSFHWLCSWYGTPTPFQMILIRMNAALCGLRPSWLRYSGSVMTVKLEKNKLHMPIYFFKYQIKKCE